MGVIYKTTNLINGKIYIGKRIFDKNKFLKTKYYGSGKLLKQSINKYGTDNFIREILEEVDNNILGEREIFWIEFYNSTNLDIGYNLTIGGNGLIGKKGHKMSEETKEKISKIIENHWKNNKHPFQDKKHSDESKEKMSISKKGKKLTKEQKENIGNGHRGLKYNKIVKQPKEKIDKRKKIIQKSLDDKFIRIWNSIAEAAEYYKFDRSCISRACSKYGRSHGFIWEFLEKV